MIILLCGTQAIGQEISDSLRLHFQQSKSLLNESVAGNSQFYGSLADLLEMAKRKDVEIVSITVYGAASPEGGIGYNKGLSKRRADRIASYISEIGGGRISPEVIAVGRDWKGLLGVSRNLVGINFRHPNVMPNFAVWKTITYRHWHRWCCQPRF